MASKIQETKNHNLFISHDPENRPTDARKHKKLKESMRLYGFLRCFPIVVVKDAQGRLIVKDGQHRLMFAQELGLSVFYVEEETAFDIAVVNSTAKPWTIRDYADKHAANGLSAFTEAIAFAEAHGLPMGTAFCLLAGTTSFSNVSEAVVSGGFVVKDRPWADAVAGIYGPLVRLSHSVKSARFIEACMAVCRVKDFEPKRLIQSAERCRDKLVSYSTRDAFLEMLEAVYNFGRSKLVGLKAAALNAMRERLPNKTTKKTPSDAA